MKDRCGLLGEDDDGEGQDGAWRRTPDLQLHRGAPSLIE